MRTRGNAVIEAERGGRTINRERGSLRVKCLGRRKTRGIEVRV